MPDLRKQKAVKIKDAIDIVVVGGESTSVENVPASATVVTLKALNVDRTGLTIYNDSTNTLYVKYGAGASPTSYTAKLRKEDYMFIDDYRGIVTGVWNGTNGFAFS